MIHSANFFKGQLKFMILKALSQNNSLHGYGLMKEIRANCMNLWQPSFGALYPALEELNHDKLIEVKKIQTSGRKKKLYALTKLGRKKFKELSIQVNQIEKNMLGHIKAGKFKKHGFEDIISMINALQKILGKAGKKYNTTMLEFAMLAKNGKISKTEKKQVKNALITFLEIVEKTSKKAKKKSR